MWTLGLLFRMGPSPNINPLYAYDPTAVAGQVAVHEAVEPAAVVRPCTNAPDNTRWCAAYQLSLGTAAIAAAELTRTRETALLGTIYPLPGQTPRETFLSWHAPIE